MTKRKSYYRKLSDLTPEEMAIYERNVAEARAEAKEMAKKLGIHSEVCEPKKFSKWL